MFELSTQVRLICEVETAIATSTVGAAGADGAAVCVEIGPAVANAEAPALFTALIRKEYAVDAFNPVTLKLVAFAAVVPAVVHVVPSVEYSTLNPASSLELSVQVRSISALDAEFPESAVGATGAVVDTGAVPTASATTIPVVALLRMITAAVAGSSWNVPSTTHVSFVCVSSTCTVIVPFAVMMSTGTLGALLLLATQ